MATKIKNKNLLCATAITNCINILINENSALEERQTATEQAKIIFQNVMPFLRGEKDAVETVNNAIDLVTKAAQEIESFDTDIFVKELCEQSELSVDYARIYVLPSYLSVVAELLASQEEAFTEAANTVASNPIAKISDVTPDCAEAENTLRNRMLCVTDILCKGYPPFTASKQLLFINEVLNIPVPEFIGEQKCQEMIEAILNSADENYPLDTELIKDLVYGIFHKTNLGKLVANLTSKPTKSNLALLEEVKEKYDLKNSSIYVDDPYYVKKAERSSFVKGLQKYTLETLILTKKFLESQGLRFYLTEGTLLGAVRHNGFIPWDDDIDIAMPRADYNRLVKLAKDGAIPPELNFDSLETNPKHWVLGAKMQLVRETPYIQHKVTKLSRCDGPYVDIFPLDCCNNPYRLKFRIADIFVKLSRRMLFIKTGYSVATKKKPLRILMRMFLPFVTNRWIEEFAIKNMTKFYKENPKYYVNLCSYYPFYKEVFPAGFFGEPKYISFEGEMMPVPCEYDYMLKTVYGRNYDTIPPVKVTNMRKHAFELKEQNQSQE